MHHFALVDQLRRRGFRLTRQREVILQALSELDGHASVEQVHAQACSYSPEIDLSTVYRTLETLCEMRVLSCADLGQGHLQFEIVTGAPHHHLICQGCGQVTVLDHSYLAAAAEAIRRDFGFDPIFDHFAVFGLCANCRAGNQAQG
jgi:Fur family ferric uptake transcriptional regulator